MSRRTCWIVGGGVVALVLAAATLLAVWRDVRSVRAEVMRTRATVDAIVSDPAALRTTEGRLRARTQLDKAVADIDAASQRARNSFPLMITAVVPGLRSQRSGFLRLVQDADEASRSGRALLQRVDDVAKQSLLQDGELPLDGLRRLEVDTREASVGMAKLVRSSNGLVGSLADARRTFDSMASRAAQRLHDGADVLEAARTFLGAGAPRRYFVAVQNNAEMRDQGMTLSYVVVRFADKKLTVERKGHITDLTLKKPVSTPLPDGMQTVFGNFHITKLWQNVNATADFAWSPRTMRDMYAQATGERVDGVIALDVPALEGLLRVLGPVTVPGIDVPLTGTNATQVLLHDLYQLASRSDQADRYDHLNDFAKAVIERLTHGRYDAVAAARELIDGAAGGHLRLWSADPAEEQVFERSSLGGGPASVDADRTFHLAVENRTATKLDYYVRPRVQMNVYLSDLGHCGRANHGGHRQHHPGRVGAVIHARTDAGDAEGRRLHRLGSALGSERRDATE